MRLLYTLIVFLLFPLVLPYLIWRGFAQHDYWHRWGERLGLVRPAPDGVAVWVHAVSVGEVMAALPLIRALVVQHGRGQIWVTTVTPTGSARVREALGEQVRHSYLPYDLPLAVARFVARVRPQRVVVIETELWPHLFRALRQRGIPLLIANARLSPRSFKGYSRVWGFAAEVLSDCTAVAAQSELDAQRFRALGAARVSVMGNLKFDLHIPAQQVEQGRALRAAMGSARPVWIAASTHEGEEAAALAAHQTLLRERPDALLILVPRHPQRFDAVARSIEKSGLTFTRRSTLVFPNPESLIPNPVLLGDSMGEMFIYFAASDLAFVGGSLMPIGGHNVLEPAALGLPVLFGPHMHNFLGARDLLLSAQAAEQCVDGSVLGQRVLALLADAPLRARMGAAGRAAVENNRGALHILLELLGNTASAAPASA